MGAPDGSGAERSRAAAQEGERMEKNPKKEIFTFKLGGITAAGALLCCNAALGMFYRAAENSTVLPIATACVTAGLLLDNMFAESKYEKLFKACGLVVKDTKGDKIPKIIKQGKKDGITTLVVHLPEGLSQKQFEQKQTELEQGLNCKIEFSFNKNLIMKLINFNLSTKYDYSFEERKAPTEVFAGYTHEGKFYFDIDEAVQTLVAGEPKAGKSSFLRTLILSLIQNKHDINIHLIDFQDAELGLFADCKKVKSFGTTPEDFEKLLDEMEEEAIRRLKTFASMRKKHFIQNLSVWNKVCPNKAMPYIVCFIDEFSRVSDYEGIMNKFRIRVAMDRKVGILYVASMQRPDVKIISGSIKGCMPTRLSFKVVTGKDSEVILDVEGAEKIKNRGRCVMKYLGEIKEVQCLYIEPEDVRTILKKNNLFKPKEDTCLKEKAITQAIESKKEYLKDWHSTHAKPYGVK
jgi:hypothetical protein